MHHYQICGLHLESSIRLPELPESTAAPTAGCFVMVPGASPAPESQAWIHQWLQADGSPWSSLSRYQGEYLLRFHGMADFLMSNDGVQIRCYSVNGTPDATLRHLLLDQVIPLALSRQGNLVLHCSAVVTPAGAIAFAGDTGMGKSTLAASFCRRGFAALTDDGLLVEQQDNTLLAFPGYPGLRLWDDSVTAVFPAGTTGTPVAHYTSKVRVALGSDRIPFCDQPVPLRRIYFLGLASTICIEPIAPSDGFMALVQQSYRLDPKDQTRLRQEFERLRRVAALPLLRRLAFPYGMELLPEVQEAVLQDIGREENI